MMKWSAWLVILLLLVAVAIIIPALRLPDPLAPEPTQQFQPPDSRHWLGTDQFGRDIFSRTLWGIRYSLFSAALATAIAMIIGVTFGGLAGTFGGWVDWLIMRGVDILLAFPGLLLAMTLIAMFDTGLWQVALAVGVALAPAYSRLTRAAVISVRSQLFVEAAVALGSSRWRIIWQHLLPNAAGQIMTFATVIYAWSLLNIATLDYLGLTGSPSVPTWGRMLNEGRAFLRITPWIALGPGALLTLSVLSVTGLSDAWRVGQPGSH